MNTSKDEGGYGSRAEREVLAAAHEIFGETEINMRAPFGDLGGDSLSGAILLARLWERTGIRLPLSDLRKTTTLAELAGRVEEAQETK